MATTRRDGNETAPPPPDAVHLEVSVLELVSFLQRRAVNELIVVEDGPGRYRVEVRIAWRSGRSTLRGTRGPRIYRNLNTLVTHLKTLGIGSTLVRLELRV